MRVLIGLLLSLLPLPSLAAECPAPPDHGAELSALLAEVQAATSQGVARELTNRMWEFWADAPDEAAQAVLDHGMERSAANDFLAALEAFDKLVVYCPDYAEGYNQRAFVNFLRQDYAAALPDLDRALDLSPQHIGALSGRALTLMGLGRDDEAQAVLREAVKLNPWLSERGLLRTPPGTDL